MDGEDKKPMPKRSCLITLMFAIDTDEQALTVKQAIDKAIADITEKRYSFQINES